MAETIGADSIETTQKIVRKRTVKSATSPSEDKPARASKAATKTATTPTETPIEDSVKGMPASIPKPEPAASAQPPAVPLQPALTSAAPAQQAQWNPTPIKASTASTSHIPSKILDQVRQLSSTSAASAPKKLDTTSTIKPTSTTTKSTAKTPTSTPAPKPPTPNLSKPSSPTTSTPPSHPPSKPSIPISALNRTIVNNLTSNAVGGGARIRPPPHGQKPLPSNYNSVARKVTMAIVALPIALVTSWVLWERCKSPLA